MMENAVNGYSGMEVQAGRTYIFEKTADGKFILITCGTDRPETQADRCTVSVAEFAENWLSAAKVTIKESTYMKYWNLLHSYIIPELGGLEWNALNRCVVENFCAKMLTAGGQNRKGLSAKTAADIMSVLRSVAAYAAGHGAAESFNLSSVTIKKEQKEISYLTRKQQDRLYRHLRAELSDRNLGLLICMFTGLRLGEICALRWEDISFSEQTIHVHQTMQRIQTKDDPNRKTKIVITSPKSGSSVRRIPIPRELLRILYSFRENRTGYVLTGRPDAYVEPRTMERHFDKILRCLGMEHINFHALRHTFATRCVEMDFDVKSLSEILGHANINITLNRYVHPTMELKRRNMQKLSPLMAVGW